MKFQAIHRSTTPEMIIGEILKSVKSGKLKPGDKLPPERELTQMFGVGRSSIREAITALALMGYLDVTQGKGAFLKDDIPSADLSAAQLNEVLAAESIFDLIEVREILECSIVQIASVRAASKHIRRLRTALNRMKECKEDVKAFYDADFYFHMALAEATDNKMICEMMKLIVEKAHKNYAKFIPDTLCDPESAIRTAEQIVSTLSIQGGGKKAADHMRAHLNIVKAELKRVLPHYKRR